VRRRTGAARLPIRGGAYMSAPDGATWRSGYATVCKSELVYSVNRVQILQ